MEFLGTKGKWCSEWMNGNHYIHKEKSKYQREYIGQMFYLKNEENTHNPESYYNALLISKAPEMLEMLQFVKSNGSICDWNKLEKELEKLIKQATEI